jgi:HAD superfamily hydrolase (TIGR01484 family)
MEKKQKSEVRLVLADLDGTIIVPETGQVSERVAGSIREAEARGVYVAAVTGRPMGQAKPLLQAAGITHPSVFEGGGIIANSQTGEILWEKRLPQASARQAIRILLQHAIRLDYGIEKPLTQMSENDVTEDIMSIWAAVPTEDIHAIINELKPIPQTAVHANAAPGGDVSLCGIQITHMEADKSHAVRKLLEILELDSLHTLGIGDGDNDLPLFAAASLKIAMGNASLGLKTAADEVVASVHEDGFADAIDTFVLGKGI